jgi:uncharacterized membrane protein YqaE (UPF0057 family)
MSLPGKPGAGTIIAAILLPPLGVWINRGIGPAFLVSVILTIIGYVPGIIFSLIAIYSPDLLPNRR